MRRIFILLMLTIALVAHASAQQKKTDIEHAGLIGKVKAVKVEESKLSNKSGKQVEGKRVHVETQSYGENGSLTKAIRFDAGRATDYFYSYDGNGNRLELIRMAAVQSRIKTEFKYDANGNRIEEVQTGDEGLVNKLVYVFDAKGRPTERRIYNKQGLFAKRTYVYADGLNPTQEAEYDAKGALTGIQSYSYELDPAGNWIKRTTSSHGKNNGKEFTEPVEVTYRTIIYY